MSNPIRSARLKLGAAVAERAASLLQRWPRGAWAIGVTAEKILSAHVALEDKLDDLWRKRQSKQRKKGVPRWKDTAFKRCWTCVAHPVCAFRVVDRAVEDVREAQRTVICPGTFNPEEAEYLWSDGKWNEPYHDIFPQISRIPRWPIWREKCTCCHRTYLTLFWGHLRIPVRQDCPATIVQRRKPCKRCSTWPTKLPDEDTQDVVDALNDRLDAMRYQTPGKA